LFELVGVEQVCVVDGQDGVLVTFVAFSGEQVGGLGDERAAVEAGGDPEGVGDLLVDAAGADGGVGDVDSRVAGRVLWRWEEKDFGFRFRSGKGKREEEYYQAARAGQQAVLKAQIESEMLTQRLEAMEDEAATAIQQITVLTGGKIHIGITDEVAEPETAGISVSGISMSGIPDHPELEASRAMEASEQAMIRMNRTMLRPELTLGLGINLMPAARERQFGWEPVTPMIGVMLPLWRGGVRASVREAELRRQQRRHEQQVWNRPGHDWCATSGR
jgi:hypothetical protein